MRQGSQGPQLFLIHTRDTVLLIAAPACVFLCHPGSWVSIRASLSWTSFARNYWIISDLIFQVLILNFKEHASWLFESPYFNLHIHWSILILAIIAELFVLDILFLFQQGRGPIFGLLSLSGNLLGTIGNVGTDHCHCWLICWSIVFHFIIPYTFEEKKLGGWVKIIVLEYYIHLLFFILFATPCTLKTWCTSLSLIIIVLHGRCMVLLLYMYYNAWLIEAMATKCLSIITSYKSCNIFIWNRRAFVNHVMNKLTQGIEIAGTRTCNLSHKSEFNRPNTVDTYEHYNEFL